MTPSTNHPNFQHHAQAGLVISSAMGMCDHPNNCLRPKQSAKASIPLGGTHPKCNSCLISPQLPSSLPNLLFTHPTQTEVQFHNRNRVEEHDQGTLSEWAPRDTDHQLSQHPTFTPIRVSIGRRVLTFAFTLLGTYIKAFGCI